MLFDLSDSNVKFEVDTLMRILRDSRHEGWVLAAYPDPKTSRPLIGAGFGLDVPATQHLQRDPLNPHTFLEPSASQLWQAAGLDPGKLQAILEQYDRNLSKWKKKKYRRKIRAHTLTPQITEEEASSLLRISATQAIYNARAYCRGFDQLTASQQMALSQLVYQMGTNLEQFVTFLGVLNDSTSGAGQVQLVSDTNDAAHWKAVQMALMQSQWARRYRNRAVAVIAMFDPKYEEDPRVAERQVSVVLRPPKAHHRRKAHIRSAQARAPRSASAQRQSKRD